MTKSQDDEEPVLETPLDPKGKDGRVRSVNPPDAALNMTPDAAEISGLRLLDAADKARGPLRGR